MIKILNPMFECPRFDSCSVNHCPLDVEKDKHFSLKSDKEGLCTSSKKIRMRIGEELSNLGLKGNELRQMRIYHPELFKEQYNDN